MPNGATTAAHEAVAALHLPPLTERIYRRTGWLPISAVVAAVALLKPDTLAVVEVSSDGGEHTWSWAEFVAEIESAAGGLLALGVGSGARVAVALPNGAAHIITVQAAWRLGASVVLIDPQMSSQQRQQMLASITPVTLVEQPVRRPVRPSAAPSHRLADPHTIVATGGTVSTPRLAVQNGSLWGRLGPPPARLRDGYGLAFGQVQLVTLPLHHGFGHTYTHQFGLAYGHSMVVLQRFETTTALAAIDRWNVTYMATVPTILSRIAHADSFLAADLALLEGVMHAAAPCPDRVKRIWIDRIGASRVFEAFGSTDVSLDCTIRGDEWLARPTSVGRPVGTEVQIRSESGAVLSVGTVGDIWVRPVDRRAAHPEIVGDEMHAPRDLRRTGDLGFVDEDGYLHVVGRSELQLICGGQSIDIEEIEDVLADHPAVIGAAVVAVPHEDLGEVPHALVQLTGQAEVTTGDLLDWCRARLRPGFSPRSLELVDELPLTTAGKLDRAALRRRAVVREQN